MMRAEPVSRGMPRAPWPRLTSRAGSSWVVRVTATASLVQEGETVAVLAEPDVAAGLLLEREG